MDFFTELETLIDRAVNAGIARDEIIGDLLAKVEAMEDEAAALEQGGQS
jgi:hypothetical protein